LESNVTPITIHAKKYIIFVTLSTIVIGNLVFSTSPPTWYPFYHTYNLNLAFTTFLFWKIETMKVKEKEQMEPSAKLKPYQHLHLWKWLSWTWMEGHSSWSWGCRSQRSHHWRLLRMCLFNGNLSSDNDMIGVAWI